MCCSYALCSVRVYPEHSSRSTPGLSFVCWTKPQRDQCSRSWLYRVPDRVERRRSSTVAVGLQIRRFALARTQLHGEVSRSHIGSSCQSIPVDEIDAGSASSRFPGTGRCDRHERGRRTSNARRTASTSALLEVSCGSAGSHPRKLDVVLDLGEDIERDAKTFSDGEPVSSSAALIGDPIYLLSPVPVHGIPSTNRDHVPFSASK